MSHIEENNKNYVEENAFIFKEYCNISTHVNIDQNEKHFRGKCAEVFIENGKYFLNCYFCGQNLKNINKLLGHIYKNHFILDVPGYWDHQQQETDQPTSKNIENDPQNIFFKSEIKLNNTSYIDASNNETGTFDLDENDTNEQFTEEFKSEELSSEAINNTSIEIINESENLGIPSTPIQYRDSNGLYPCTFCTRSFKKLQDLEYHFKKHTNTDQNESKTGECKYDNTNSYPTEYIKGKRHEDGSYHCDICNRKYLHHYNYRAHFLQAHQPHLNPYKCPDCPLTYTMRHRYEIHRRTHTKEKPYKCPHCPKAFALNTNLTRHIYIHLGKKPYKCRYCCKGFTQQNSQICHERNIHTKERPHQCELCGKSFPRSTLLKEHWKRHTNTREFKCEICFKNFFNNTSLKLHLNTHTKAKSYDCNLCSKKFTNVNSLRTHKKLHSDIKQYQCKLCDKAFAQNAGLYGHMKIYHNSVTKQDN